MDQRLYIKTMGYPELRSWDGRSVKLKVRKHLALLIYLAVDQRPAHRRDSLVHLLWGGVPESKGRHSLSMGLSVIRALLGPAAVRTTSSTVRLERGAVHLDLEALTHGELFTSDPAAPLEVDGFLLDFEIEDAPDFQHWRDTTRAQLLPIIQAGVITLVDHARRTGNVTEIMRRADRLLALDELSEEGVRAKMEAFTMLGDRVSALRIYEEWRGRLAKELSADPSELLQGLAGRLRRSLAGFKPMPLERPGAEAEVSPNKFVGRSAEFRAIFEAWEATTQFNTRHVLITGEPGIGKTTLAQRFAATAALEGAAVARVQCFELEQRFPYGTMAALVATILDRPGAMATDPHSLAEIARVVPAVRERIPNLPVPRRAEDEAANLQLADAIFELFDSVMEEQPLVIIVDDYPRADEASLGILHMLLRRPNLDRLMLVLTARPPEPKESPAASRIRTGVSELPLRWVDLAPLSQEECEEALRLMLESRGKVPGPPIRRALIRASAGNPMALEMLAHDWAAHGDASVAVSLPAMQTDIVAATPAAMRYDRVIDSLLPSLSPRTRTALQLAAILGKRVGDLGCFVDIGLSRAQALSAISELIAHRVLRDAGTGLAFVNDLIRARVYLKIPTTMRVRLHNEVANRLQALREAGEDVDGLEIAWHCIRSRRNHEGTPYLLNGAREAIARGAPDEAVHALASALGSLKGRAKQEARVLLAETYQEMAEWKVSLEVLGELDLDIPRDFDLKELARLLEIGATRQLQAMSEDEYHTAATDLIRCAKTMESPSGRARALLGAVQILSVARDTTRLNELAHDLEAIPAEPLPIREAGMVWLARAMAQYYGGAIARSTSTTKELCAFLERNHSTDSTLALARIGLGALACASGNYDEGLPPLESAYTLARRLDNPSMTSQAAGNLILCHYRLGNYSAARDIATTMKHTGSCPIASLIAAKAAWIAGSSAVFLGLRDSATKQVETIDSCLRQFLPRWCTQQMSFFKADLLWLLGRRKESRAVAKIGLELGEGPLAPGITGSFSRWSALTGKNPEMFQRRLEHLLQIRQREDPLDAIDKVELACSIVFMQARLATNDVSIQEYVRAGLADLPSAYAKQLVLLGVLAPNCGAQAFPKASL